MDYLRALQSADLFPLDGDDNTLCIFMLSERLQQVKTQVPSTLTCQECAFETNTWVGKIDAILQTTSAMVDGVEKELKAYFYKEVNRQKEDTGRVHEVGEE